MKHLTLVILAVTLSATAARAQDYGTAGARGFSLERWEEDYSYLKDPKARSDFFDPIKYVPISESNSVYASFGGQARYRYDYFNNRDFGPGNNDENGFHLQRYLVHGDLHVGDHFRAFAQIGASFIDGREGGGRYGDADTFDLAQGFIDITTSADADPYVMLRLGRQELIYGAQRYVSPDDWRNVRRWFDGARLSVSIPNNTTDLFATRTMTIDRDEYDDSDAGSYFSGIYNATALPRFIEGGDSKLETYLFALNQTEHSLAGFDADVYTAGARLSSRPAPLDFDVEGNYQFGTAESSDMHAWSIASELGYSFPSIELSPRASIGFDMASGSSDIGGRFNPLFPPTYNYLGHLYLFGRPNLIDAHVGLDLHLTKDLGLFVSQHVFWRQNTNDGLYSIGNTLVRGDNGSDARYVGNEFDIVMTWQIDRHISTYIGYAHFFSGDFISETGPSRDVDFLYASVTYTF